MPHSASAKKRHRQNLRNRDRNRAVKSVLKSDVRKALDAIEAGDTDSARAALHDCDALLIVTEWKEFRSPDFDAIRTELKQPVVIDGRNLYDPALAAGAGIEYYPIGRAQAKAAAAP